MPTRATTPAPAPATPQAVRIQQPNPDAFPPIAKAPAARAKTLKPTYVNAAQVPITRMSQSFKKAKAASLRPQSSQPQLRSDNRLFARMEEHNKWLTILTYTALCAIKARLPEEARGAIAELQRTRTGFAIRPSSDAVELKQYIPILQT
ncbi:hypothetical protein K3495_g16654, partial [Podosphaera aphanis]